MTKIWDSLKSMIRKPPPQIHPSGDLTLHQQQYANNMNQSAHMSRQQMREQWENEYRNWYSMYSQHNHTARQAEWDREYTKWWNTYSGHYKSFQQNNMNHGMPPPMPSNPHHQNQLNPHMNMDHSKQQSRMTYQHPQSKQQERYVKLLLLLV